MKLLGFQLTVLASVVLLPGVLPQPNDNDGRLYCSICKAVVDEVLYALDPKYIEQAKDDGKGFGEITGDKEEAGVSAEGGATGTEAKVSTPEATSDVSKPESAAVKETPVDQDTADGLFNEKLEGIIKDVCGKTMENYGLDRPRHRSKMRVKRITPFTGGEDVEMGDMEYDEDIWEMFKSYCLFITEDNKKFMLEIFKMKHLTPHELKVELCLRTAEACKPEQMKDAKEEPEEPKNPKKKKRMRPRRKRPFRGGRGRRSSDRGGKRGRKSRRRSRRDVDEDEYDDDDEEEWSRHREKRSHSRDPDDDEDLKKESPGEEGLEEDSAEPLDEDELRRRESERRIRLDDEIFSYGKSYKSLEEYREEYGEDGVDEMEFFENMRKRRRRRERRKRGGKEDEDDPSYQDDPLEEQEEPQFQEEIKRGRARAKKKKTPRRRYDEL